MKSGITHHSTNTPASPFAIGTIYWGTTVVGDDLDRLYATFREAGGNFFDTAHVYAFWRPNGTGSSERALGEIVRRNNDRKNVIIATKGAHPHADGGYDRPDRCMTPEVIASDIRESLDRLGVDRIDLYFLHRDDPRVPVEQIVDTLNEHIRAGELHQLGASNWKTDRIDAANKYAAATGKVGFITSQPRFSLAVPKPSKDVTVPLFGASEIAWHERTVLSVCAYTPTASGYFATNGVKAAKGLEPVSESRLRAANEVAAELGVTAGQVALAYLLHQRFPVIPILGTTNVEHLNEAIASQKAKLTSEHMRRLTA